MKFFIARFVSAIFKIYFSLRYGSKVKWGRNTILNHRFKFKGAGRLIIGDNVNLWAHKEPNEFLTFSAEAVITVGHASRLNGVTVQCKEAVTIGNDCLIGSAMLIDTDFHSIHFENRNNPLVIKSAPIVIGDHVWLAGQSAILKGVKIGDESVVGFRAVVAKNVPDRKVVAGNPAQIVKDIE